MRRTLAVALLAAFSGACRAPLPTLLAKETRVAVVEFTVAEDAKIARYNAPYDTIGRELADWIVERLKRRGRNAEVVPASMVPDANLIVTGEITRLDGGSAAKRMLIGWGAGHATVAVMGEVRHGDGTRVATFSDERIGGGWGNRGALENAWRRVGNSVSDMIFRGQYRGGRPGSPGFVVRKESEPVQRTTVRSTQDRLRELDDLKARGLVSEDEYRAKRQRIIDEF